VIGTSMLRMERGESDGGGAERVDRRRAHRAETHDDGQASRVQRKRQESIGDMIAALLSGKPVEQTPAPQAQAPVVTVNVAADDGEPAETATSSTATNAALPEQILATQVQQQLVELSQPAAELAQALMELRAQLQAQAVAQTQTQAQSTSTSASTSTSTSTSTCTSTCTSTSTSTNTNALDVPAAAPNAELAKPAKDAASMQPETETNAVAARPAPALPTLTPLEAVVHDLIERSFADKPHRHSMLGTEAAPTAEAAALLPAGVVTQVGNAPATVAAPAQGPAIGEPLAIEQLSAETAVQRLRMVVGEDANRIVVSVAVRGAVVDVSLRAHDDATAAALARNLGTLDHALRARGLELGDQPDHDSDSSDRSRREAPHRDRSSQEETP
jgi:hypothetical protein